MKLTKTVAGMVKEMRDCKFDRIGGVYLEAAVAHDAMDKLTAARELVPSVTNRATTEGVETPVSQSTKASSVGPRTRIHDSDARSLESSIGPAFDPLFFVGNRLQLPGNRGPYSTSSSWLTA